MSNHPPCPDWDREIATLRRTYPHLLPDEVDTARRTSISERPGTAIYISPMLRALRTAAPLAAALGLAPQVWTDIFEHGGLFTGDPRAGEVVNYKVTPLYEDGQLHPTAVVLQAEGSEGLSLGITIHNRNAQE